MMIDRLDPVFPPVAVRQAVGADLSHRTAIY